MRRMAENIDISIASHVVDPFALIDSSLSPHEPTSVTRNGASRQQISTFGVETVGQIQPTGAYNLGRRGHL